METIAMLRIGDAVVHPSHGAGVLEETQTWRVSGVERQYHRIELASGRGTLFIPTNQVQEAGLTPVPGDAEPIISVLLDQPRDLSADYQKRKAGIAAKVRSGDVTLVAAALRDLAWRDQESKLSDGDAQLKVEAQALLASVLAVQLDLDIDAATHHLNLTVNHAIQSRLVQDEVE
jgi:RNA polymerase-interacting CarD/CdnL/TRCF family regulator